MDLVAVVVLIAHLAVSSWSWRVAPAKQAADQFAAIWRVRPWGKQLFVDFFGLEAILALWMLADAAERGGLGTAIACIVTMPLLGATSAAAYWLLR